MMAEDRAQFLPRWLERHYLNTGTPEFDEFAQYARSQWPCLCLVCGGERQVHGYMCHKNRNRYRNTEARARRVERHYGVNWFDYMNTARVCDLCVSRVNCNVPLECIAPGDRLAVKVFYLLSKVLEKESNHDESIRHDRQRPFTHYQRFLARECYQGAG